MRIPPEWAVQTRSKMLTNGIRARDVAQKLGKSEQWISNILTGLYNSEGMKTAICECVDKLILERMKDTA